MASISKFSTALLSVPNEITVAAANFNVNFSLMKVEAPPEFHGLRDALSQTRRREAEEGVIHITARCLGALFDPIIPPIPRLTATYGERVSELSGQMETVSQFTGMFADRAGADGTSIWAAATSGQHAIAMHLLACMLARIWKPAEATSIWVELVERRKGEIFKAYNASNATGVSSVMAAQQLFNRDQLSAWDASARSWLRAADSRKRFIQTQLMLIINNVRMPVNTSKDSYESVISAWTSGMNTMERLICGVPQRVQDGAILLSISSWHLYPNIQVLSDHEKHIPLGDELMAHSLLTISTSGASDDRDGVFWSLPLSRMRYYSPPVMSTRSIASNTSRISMDEFQIVCLGAFIAQWREVCNNEMRCCDFIIRLREVYQRFSLEQPAWFALIAGAASRVILSSGHLRAQYSKLLKLGSRRCEAFFHESGLTPPPFFGLVHFHVLIKALADTKERIRLLRVAAASRKVKANETIIRYRTIDSRFGTRYQYASALPHNRGSCKRSADQLETPSAGHQQFIVGRYLEPKSETTCFGADVCGCLDPAFGSCLCFANNSRCTSLCHPETEMCHQSRIPGPLLLDCQKMYCTTVSPCAGCQDLVQRESNKGEVEGCIPGPQCQKMDCSFASPCVGCHNRGLLHDAQNEGQESVLVHPLSLDLVDEYQFRLRKPDDEVMRTYQLMLGHGSIAAVYQAGSRIAYDTYNRSPLDFPLATIDEIEAAISSEFFNPSNLDLDTCCGHWSGLGLEQTTCSLAALVFASTLYESMPESTVSIEVITSPMYLNSWALYIQNHNSIYTPPERGMWWHADTDLQRTISQSIADPEMDRLLAGSVQSEGPSGDSDDLSEAWSSDEESDHELNSNAMDMILKRSFACIAWFESGEFDIPVDQLNAVMALVNGDSIYVASSLLTDPSDSTPGAPIRRIFGNLGRSDMSLLVPPADPRLAEPELRYWKHINHSEFDGKLVDCFKSTSLHLTFTDSEDAVYLGNRGLRDRQVVFLEALVSIDDRGRNIGDLDILSMFSTPSFRVMKPCAHTKEQREIFPRRQHLTAIDCWDEFLDPPDGPAIFRARGNWQARLGAAAAAVRVGKRVIVLPEQTCLQCLGALTMEPRNFVIA
jgi:hypothetical protein